MPAFARAEDIENRWRPLSPSEIVVANTLLDDASDIIRTRFPGIGNRIGSDITALTLTRVACGMVKRALMNAATEGVTQQSQAAGPFNQSQTFANPNGNLYLSADEVAALEGRPARGGVKVAWLA